MYNTCRWPIEDKKCCTKMSKNDLTVEVTMTSYCIVCISISLLTGIPFQVDVCIIGNHIDFITKNEEHKIVHTPFLTKMDNSQRDFLYNAPY